MDEKGKIFSLQCISFFSTDQLNTPEFPLIPDCHQKDVDLILVSDAASDDYATQLELFLKIVDMFSSGQENLEHLRVAMAVSGSNSTGGPEVSWLFHLGTLSKASDIKTTIVKDKIRPRSMNSYLKEAADAVNDAVKAHADLSGDSIPPPKRTGHERGTRTSISTSEAGFDFNGTVMPNNSSSYDDKLKKDRILPVTLFVFFANPEINSHMYNEPDPDRFNAKKLLVVFVYPRTRGGMYFPCRSTFQSPCINLLAETMLNDHTLSLALCDRCFHGWFGPMPNSVMFENHTTSATQSDPLMTYTSCYRVMSMEKPDCYGRKAADVCKPLEASLVSIESEREIDFLKTELTERCLAKKSCPGSTTAVFIGLRRDRTSLGKRFRWINGRPLVYSLWEPDFPLGGPIHGCVVWGLRMGWSDIGCGQLLHNDSFSSLCEWTKLRNPKALKMSVPDRPSEESIRHAINRGQVGICGTEPEIALRPTQYAVPYAGCFLHTNNTGRVQAWNVTARGDLFFPCREGPFSSIQFSSVCDQMLDCDNNKDESPELCRPSVSLEKDVYTCLQSKKAVAEEARCDLYPDCVDESDEENCETCRFGLCSDGRCVPYTWLIDGEKDCLTLFGADRPDMNNSVNAEIDCAFMCNRSKCVPWSKLGDGVVDCRGPEGPLDETLGALQRAQCGGAFSKEWAPRCVYQKDRLGELIGCRNMRHLHGCEDFVCPEGYIKCPRGYCIPLHYLNNRDIDCPMGEDETGELIRGDNSIPGFFRCYLFGSVLLHPDRVCDRSWDCNNGEDETGCHVTCAEGFLCAAGIVIADGYDRSDPLTNISFLDPRTRVIDFSGINVSSALTTITDLGLDYLLDLRLSNCSLIDVLGPYKVLPRLSKLDLSYNLFRNISNGDFNTRAIYYSVRYLRFLNLSHNSLLDFFDTATIAGNAELRILDLSYTAITTFPDMNYVTYSLTHLNLSHTNIKRLPGFVFPQGYNSWNLEILDLHGTDIKDVEPDALIGLRIVSDLHSDYFKLCCPQLRGQRIPAHTCHAPSDPLSSCSNLLENGLLRILIWVMGVASVLGNTGVIVIRLVAGRKTVRLPYAHLVTQLGMSDLLMGVYLLIVASKDVQYSGEYVWHDNTWRHSDLCKTAGFLSTLSSEVSSLFILLITVDRFLVIKYPFGQRRLSLVGIVTCSILAWGLGLILAAVPLLPPTKHWDIYTSNAVCLGLPLLSERRPGWQYSTVVLIAFNSLLCVAIALGQLGIYRAVSSGRKSAPASGAPCSTFSSSAELSPRMKEDLALARRLAAVAFTDLLCWMPVGVLGLLALAGQGLDGDAYAWVAVFVLPVNSALNPVLYSLPVIRDYIAKTLAKWMTSQRKTITRSSDDGTSSRI